MPNKPNSLRERILVTSLALLSNGCGITGTGSWVDIVWPQMTDEFYRMEGTVCTQPKEVKDQTEGITMSMRFSFSKLGEPCQERAREVMVLAGDAKSWERTKNLKINQRVVVIGTIAGSNQDLLLAARIVPNRR